MRGVGTLAGRSVVVDNWTERSNRPLAITQYPDNFYPVEGDPVKDDVGGEQKTLEPGYEIFLSQTNLG
jgi:hypothetical protein